MNKTSTKTLITLAVVLISFIFIVEFTSPIQSINIGHLQKRQDPPPPPKENPPPPPKENPPPPPKENPPPPPKENPPPPPKENPPPPPKENPPPPPKENPPQESPPPPKENPTPEPQPTPETPTSNPSEPPPNPSEPPPSPNPPAPNPSPPQTTDPNAPQTSSSPNPPAPNPNPPQTSDPNAPTPNPETSAVSDTTSTTSAVSPIVDSSVVTSSTGTNADTNTGLSPSPNPGVSSVSPTPPKSKSYPPGQEPCTKADDPRCGRGPTDPTVVSTTEENEIITEPSITPAGPTKSQSQLAPNPKKSTITQFTTYTTTETLYFPGYSTVTSSKGPNGELTTYATYVPPSTVVVVKKVTSAKIEEIQETNPSSAGHLDLELSVYNLYSVATSLFVISVTMLYLIVA